MQRISAIVLLLGTATAWAMVQQPQPNFRVSTERVVVEFIAVDNQGRFITDLDKDEISIEIDGRKQKIEKLFAPPSAAQDSKTASSTGPAARESAAEGETANVQRGPARTAILLDSRTLDSSNFHQSRRAIQSFIAESLQDDHFVMIAEIDRKLNVLTPFTRDREALLKALNELKPATLYNPLDTSRLRNASSRLRDGADYTNELLEQMVSVRAGMRVLMHSLSAYPGRKHVVLFSEGYPMNPVQELEFSSRLETATSKSAAVRMDTARQGGTFKDPGVISATQEIVSLANAYGVTFYTVDARGLVAVPGLSADVAPPSTLEAIGFNPVTGPPDEGLVSIDLIKKTVLGDIFDAQNFLQALAAGTNGSAFFNSNDLEAVLHASTQEQRFTYLASVIPDLKDKEKVKFRKVDVECKRKGTIVRAQAGFFNLDTRQLVGMRLAQALETPEFFKALQPVSEVGRKNGKVEVTFGIEGSQISYGPADKGLKRVEMLFLGQIFKKDGAAVFENPPIQRPFAMDLTDEQYTDLTSQPLVGHQELDLPRGSYRLVFVAEDRVAGAMGTREVEFEVN